MAPIIPIAIQLAQFAPALLRYFGVGENNVQVAERVVNIAQAATGVADPEQMRITLQEDREALRRFQELAMQNGQELERLYYADVADARKRDAVYIQLGKRNVRADSMYILSVLTVIGIFIMIWTRPEINDFVKSISTLILGRFLGYLDQMFNFEFGTTRSSKLKDDTIQKLTRQ